MEKILIEQAFMAAEQAYSPYSGYRVGAALLSKDGRIFRGCNIENASFGATNCAERTAIFKAVSEGCKEFQAIAIVGGGVSGFTEYAYPCGICRQVLQEFCEPSFTIIVAKSVEEYREYTLEELLPFAFKKE